MAQTRGGKRDGAGPKTKDPSGKAKAFTVRLSPAHLADLKYLTAMAFCPSAHARKLWLTRSRFRQTACVQRNDRTGKPRPCTIKAFDP